MYINCQWWQYSMACTYSSIIPKSFIITFIQQSPDTMATAHLLSICIKQHVLLFSVWEPLYVPHAKFLLYYRSSLFQILASFLQYKSVHGHIWRYFMSQLITFSSFCKSYKHFWLKATQLQIKKRKVLYTLKSYANCSCVLIKKALRLGYWINSCDEQTC